MSWKYSAQQHGANHYVLPIAGSMRVDVHAFLSPALYERSEEALWAQAANAATLPGVTGMYLMPDTHSGYTIPVGGVVVTEDVILQAGSGYDISCGVLYMRVPGLTAADVASPEQRRRWIDAVELRVATGVGSHRPARARGVSGRKIDDILLHGVLPLGVQPHLCERPFIKIDDGYDPTSIERAYSKARPQIGSVGGGNHFIEMQVDKDDGSVWIMVHCGSRGYGWQVANSFFYRGAQLRGLPAARKEESWLRLDEPLGKEYWNAHNTAANYAVANRHLIGDMVNDATEEVFGKQCEVYYEISHNLVQEETLVLPDGTTKKGFVHRKGATRAFPAGHPDLVGTKWSETGHPCLIPGSMFAGAAVLFPGGESAKSGYSVNHGSGRLMGRGAAKRELSSLQKDIDIEMGTVVRTLGGVDIRGILSNCANTPVDECGHVYKDLDEVLQVLVEENIATIHRRLYPVANIKGTE